jgi:peroxiredoxin
MAITVGQTLPEATFLRMGENGPEPVAFGDYVKGRRVIVFGLPGAYTGTCSTIHIPSFIRTAAAFRAKGVDEIICVSVNDPFVLKAWGEDTGAARAGITMLGDTDGSFTRALGMEFTAAAIGLIGRSNRYALIVDDGVVTHANIDAPATCKISTGEELLAAI